MTFQKIVNEELKLEPFSKFSDEGELIKDFLSKCLQKDPKERMTASELINHKWISQNLIECEVPDDKQIDIGLSLYTFKRATTFQSCVISILTRLKPCSKELSTLRNIFNELDTNKDGVLTLEEIQNGMEIFKKWFKDNLGKEPDWKKLIECIDMDKDGMIDFAEFVTAASNRYVLLMNEDNLRTAFDVLDVDGNGQITLAGLKESF